MAIVFNTRVAMGLPSTRGVVTIDTDHLSSGHRPSANMNTVLSA